MPALYNVGLSYRQDAQSRSKKTLLVRAWLFLRGADDSVQSVFFILPDGPACSNTGSL